MPVEKRSSLRARMVSLVLIPSTALLALWAVLSTVLATDIRDLNATTAFIDEVGQPVVDVITHLQWERRATMAAATPGPHAARWTSSTPPVKPPTRAPTTSTRP
ncbi:hypothetical protein KGD82_14275 [Nocardiopsis eucommiae]|uniref:Uncharacterized protein n=1 Tax=Nocardiopsis eucommiae TaxID=2831970 RepID=A0A975L5X1_9ACTN|nr:hypothetical protein KGD82_14275 [Nocardiopsis eucommiae]